MLQGYKCVENKELYHALSVQCMDSAIKMLKKGYPMYKDKCFYVLWLDLNLFTKYEWFDTDVAIHLLDENCNPILDVRSLEKPKNIVGRTPYPNKHILQMSMKSGRKVVFGYPILFDNFEDMEKIKYIHIDWTIYRPVYGTSRSSKVRELRIDRALIELETNFVAPSGDDCYWYTISRQDVLPDEFTADSLVSYDSVLSTKSEIEFIKCPSGLEFVDNICDTYFDWKDNLQGLLLQQQVDKLDGYIWSKYCVQDVLKQLKPEIMNIIPYRKVLYSYKQNVYGKIAPDLCISGAFGFE